MALLNELGRVANTIKSEYQNETPIKFDPGACAQFQFIAFW